MGALKVVLFCSTFAMIDKEGQCVPVTVYNMAAGAGFVVGDAVAIPEPFVQVTDFIEEEKASYYWAVITF